MASQQVWEATVATALRDSQWIAARGQLPGLYASLAGKPETGRGDQLFEANARFFLFELKGSVSQLSTEWTKEIEVKRGDKVIKEPSPKALHKTVLQIAKRWVVRNGVRQDDDEYNDIREALIDEWSTDHPADSLLDASVHLMQCLCGHQFVYWNDKARNARDAMSGLVVAPYLLATLHHLNTGTSTSPLLKAGQAQMLYDDVATEMVPFYFASNRTAETEASSVNAFPVSRLFAKNAFVYEKSSGTSHPLGLEITQFEAYAKFLASRDSAAHDRLNAVVFSTTGFFRTVTRLSELSQVFKQQPSFAEDTQMRVAEQRATQARNERLRRRKVD